MTPPRVSGAARPVEEEDLAPLVRDAQRGDRRAMRGLFDRFQPSILAYCTVAANGRRDLAVDLTQEVFSQVFRQLSQVREPERFAGWLFAVCANHCRRQLRGEQRRRALLERFG